MKKSLLAFMSLVTAFVATSCQNDEGPTPGAGTIPIVINAVAESIGTKSRAEMACKYDVLWSENDDICVKSSTQSATFTLAEGAGTSEGTFTCAFPAFTGNEEVEAFYPASLGEDLVWPAVQTSSTIIPMYSKKTLDGTGTEDFTFTSLGAMLQIVFTAPEWHRVTSITLQSYKRPLSGKFTIEDGQAVMDENSDNPGVTLDLGKGVEVGTAATYFYIAIPAGTSSTSKKSEAMTITLNASDGSFCKMNTAIPNAARNTVSSISLFGTFRYNVTFDLNGHGTNGPGSKAVAWNSTMNPPSDPTSNDEYIFCGWYKDKACTEKWDFERDRVDKDTTLYARWGTFIGEHEYVELAGLYWATEDVKDKEFGVDSYGTYYYAGVENAFSAADSWNEDRNLDGYLWKIPSDEQWMALKEACNFENMPWRGLIVSDKKDPNKYISLNLAGYLTPEKFVELRASGYWTEQGNVFGFNENSIKNNSFGIDGVSTNCGFTLRLVIDPTSKGK